MQPESPRRGGSLFLILSLLIFSPLAFGSVQLWARSVGSVIILLLLITALWRERERILLPPAWFSTGYLALVGLGLASAFYSPYPAETLRRSLDLFLGYLLVIGVLNTLETRSHAERLIHGIIAIGCIFCLLAFLRNHLKIWSSDRPGLAGPYGNHNHFCGLLELILPLALALFAFQIRRLEKFSENIFLGLALGVISSTLLLTYSRAGILSILAALVLVSIVSVQLTSDHPKKKTKFVFFSVAGAMMLIFVAANFPLLLRLGKSLKEPEAFFRLIVWRATGRMILDAPIWGHGLGSFPFVGARFRGFRLGHFLNYAHNDYLQVWAELGIFGLLLFLFLIVFTPVWILSRGLKHHRSLTLALVVGSATGWISLALHGLYDFNFQIPANVLFMLTILAIAFFMLREDGLMSLHRSKGLQKGSMIAGVCGILLFSTFAVADLAEFWGDWSWKKRAQDPMRKYNLAVRLNPWVAEYENSRASHFWRLGQSEQARQSFTRSLDLNSAQPNNYYHLALLEEQKDATSEKAEMLLEQAIRLDPAESKKNIEYVNILLERGEVDRALLWIRTYQQQTTNAQRAFLEKLIQAGVSDTRMADIIPPDDPPAQRKFVEFVANRTDNEGAARWIFLSQWLRELHQRQLPLPFSVLLQALSAHHAGNQTEAMFFCEDGLARFPYYPPLVELLAQLRTNAGDFEGAEMLYREQAKVEDNDEPWIDRLVGFYNRQGKTQEAGIFLADYLKQKPNSVVLKEMIAGQAIRQKDWLSASKIYKGLIRDGHNPEKYRLYLAALYIDNGLPSEAIIQWESILKTEPKRVDLLEKVARTYDETGNSAQAKSVYQRILQLQPDRSDIQQRLEKIQ